MVDQGGGTLSLGLLFSLALAIWSANKGTTAIFTALNIAYEEQEKRGFSKLNLWSLAFTVGGLAFIIVALLLIIAAVPAALAIFGSTGGVVETYCSPAMGSDGGADDRGARRALSLWAEPRGRVCSGSAPGRSGRLSCGLSVRWPFSLRPPFRELRQDFWLVGRGRHSADVVLHIGVCDLLGAELNAELERQTEEIRPPARRSLSASAGPMLPITK